VRLDFELPLLRNAQKRENKTKGKNKNQIKTKINQVNFFSCGKRQIANTKGGRGKRNDESDVRCTFAAANLNGVGPVPEG
jgi:hypothetical protein